MPDIFATPGAVVPITNELTRVQQLPRRVWEEREAQDLARRMTDILKTPGGEMSLRPIQAVALYEIGTEGGLFGPLRCGQGKTLVSLLAPVVAFAERPLLLVPAKLAQKTARDRRELAEHWQLPAFLRVMSYEWLGREQAADALEAFLPDIIIPDEAHKLQNLDAAVTRRVRRFKNAHPEVKVVPMSGTMTKRSLHDFWHLMGWALPPDKVPMPRKYQDVELWADALDERKAQMRRADPGALIVFCNEEEKRLWTSDRRAAARSAFRRRLIETAGVVASYETAVDATLTISAVETTVSPKVDEAFEKLRNTWELPDGRIVLPEDRKIRDGLGMYRHARELALGFYYIWEPPPPRYWMDARKAWYQFARKILSHSRTLDSEKQVRLAHPEVPELLEWLRVRDEFKPTTVPVWLDDSVLAFCARWADENRGIVWTDHVHFGERLARDYGLSYYGREGLDATGRYIENHPAGEPLVASMQSNAEGRNLQYSWSTALITSCPANGLQMEQLLSRLHREGQEADEVQFDLITLCAEHVGAFWQAMSDSRYVQDAMGAPQKILLAGTNVPTAADIAARAGARWQKD
jgi:hypothetical protein